MFYILCFHPKPLRIFISNTCRTFEIKLGKTFSQSQLQNVLVVLSVSWWFDLIFLQFADAEAYFAPCATDTTVNNCLVRRHVVWKSSQVSKYWCLIDSMSLKQYLDLKVPKTYKEQDLRKPLTPVWHCGNVCAGTLGWTHFSAQTLDWCVEARKHEALFFFWYPKRFWIISFFTVLMWQLYLTAQN